MIERELELHCKDCEAQFMIFFAAALDKPVCCPFCGSSDITDQEPEEEEHTNEEED